jgi:hypothetical protein
MAAKKIEIRVSIRSPFKGESSEGRIGSQSCTLVCRSVDKLLETVKENAALRVLG